MNKFKLAKGKACFSNNLALIDGWIHPLADGLTYARPPEGGDVQCQRRRRPRFLTLSKSFVYPSFLHHRREVPPLCTLTLCPLEGELIRLLNHLWTLYVSLSDLLGESEGEV